jgi:2-methylaconitate cis-trans-isomerase PrpF
MPQIKIPAAFIRGGTSKALIFKSKDLPENRLDQDKIFLATMGSPDPYGRQLDGMGGGLSSVSKICIVGPSSHPNADVDYTKGQVQLRESRVDYHTNCGNMSSAIGPFAVDEGLVKVPEDGRAMVRIFNTNTNKIIHSYFDVKAGKAIVDGDQLIPGVSGTGAAVQLDFLDPGGASTGKLLPTGNVTDFLAVDGFGKFEVSMIDAANACVFVFAKELGLSGKEMPEEIEKIPGLLEKLSAIRQAASVAMGISKNFEEAKSKSIPIIGFVSRPSSYKMLNGEIVDADLLDVTARMISHGQPHRALPITASLCLAVAARLPGSVVHSCTRSTDKNDISIGMPSGVLDVNALISKRSGDFYAELVTLIRTQRRLFDGYVYARESFFS